MDLRFIHSPQLHLAIISSRHNKWEGWVEGSPIDASLVTFEDIFHQSIVPTKQFIIHTSHNIAIVHHCRRTTDSFLSQTSCVPNTNSLIQRSRDDEIFFWVKCSAHHIVVVTSQDADAISRLPIPESYGLVVGGRHDPWILIVEMNGADVIQMTKQSEETSSQFVIPHFNFVIISTRNDERLNFMEINSTDWSFMLFEFIQ
jgi:hypothetical protein